MDWPVVHVLHAARTVHRCQAYKCIRHISLLACLHLFSSIATAQMWCVRPGIVRLTFCCLSLSFWMDFASFETLVFPRLEISVHVTWGPLWFSKLKEESTFVGLRRSLRYFVKSGRSLLSEYQTWFKAHFSVFKTFVFFRKWALIRWCMNFCLLVFVNLASASSQHQQKKPPQKNGIADYTPPTLTRNKECNSLSCHKLFDIWIISYF